MERVDHQSLQQQASHAIDETRMVLPGVQVFLGFQLIAVFNQRFELLNHNEQIAHLTAFLLVALAMALCMTPAAYHRIAEHNIVTGRFVTITSVCVSVAMLPLTVGVVIDAYLVSRLIIEDRDASLVVAAAIGIVLGLLWYVLPLLSRWRHARSRANPRTEPRDRQPRDQ